MDAICKAARFDLHVIYASPEQMTRGVREVNALAAGERLSELQANALKENVRRAMVRTAARGFLPSIAAQASLHRWLFLRQASPEAASAFLAVVGYVGLPAPGWAAQEPP